jgi:hypothetical protein
MHSWFEHYFLLVTCTLQNYIKSILTFISLKICFSTFAQVEKQLGVEPRCMLVQILKLNTFFCARRNTKHKK